MIPFKPVELCDRTWVQPLIRAEDSRSADHSFANIFVWDETFRQEIAPVCGCLAIRLGYEGDPFYAYPIGGGDTKAAILALREDAQAHGVPLRLRGITAGHLDQIKAMFPGEFILTDDRYVYDYVYSAEKLATLEGKKLHAKRNHINRFLEENPDWRFDPVTPADLKECAAFTEEWLQLNAGEHPEQYADEQIALKRAFTHFHALGLEGGILRSEGRVIGYTVGEKLNSDTYIVHFEKAHYDIQGSYAIINREYVRWIMERYPEVKYINREDDIGHENLRRAKESYYPEFLLDKHTALWR